MVLHLGEDDHVADAEVGPPQDMAMRFIASVAFLVKTTSSADGALIKRATARRAPSYASVASPASRYELRLIGA